MCKTFNKQPDDEWFDNLNPFVKLWMYEQWANDIEEKHELARGTSILTGSFSNPEMAQKMIGNLNPKFKTSDEDFDKLSQKMLEEDNSADIIDNPSGKKKKRPKLIR